MTLYQDLIEANIPVSNHESDLYFPITEQSTEILNRYPMKKKTTTRFNSNIDGTLMYDVPFAYDPWWEKRGM